MNHAEFGLLGEKLGHSFSPQIHRALGGYAYDLIELTPEELPAFLRAGRFRGVNVTIPYKQAVMPYLDEIAPEAKAIGSVNTIVKDAEGRLLGYNTDYSGFTALLVRHGMRPEGKKCLVLGSGGASKTVTACLKDLGAREIRVISRRGEDNYENLDRHRDADLIVNATPVGMYPHGGVSPVDLARFPNLRGVADLIYNPARTALLLQAEDRGIPCVNGLYMLVAQARDAVERFLGTQIPAARIDEVTADLAWETANLVLIGMPGSGKTTLGRRLAERTGKRLLDTDAMLEAEDGRTCGDIIRQDGEDAFRRKETEILRRACAQTGCVIATGGGAVTRPENRDLLRQNGMIVHVERRPEAGVLGADRPLSADPEAWERLRKIRAPLYAAWRDLRVENDDPDAAAEIILAEARRRTGPEGAEEA